MSVPSPDRNQPESPATPRHTSGKGKCCLPMPSMAFLGSPPTPVQYKPIHFQFLRSFEPKRPNIALQGTFEAVDGNLESQSMYPWDKKDAWKVPCFILFSFTSLYLPIKRSDIQNFHLLLDICLIQNSQAWWRRCDILRRNG